MIPQKCISVLLLAISYHLTIAQSPDLSLISSGGGIAYNGSVYLSYSIGEPFTSYSGMEEHWVTEGFQQPDAIDITVSTNENGTNLQINFSPNPTHDKVDITGLDMTACYQIQLINILGQIEMTEPCNLSGRHTLDLNHLQPGLYLLSIQYTPSSFYSKTIVKI